MRDRAALDAAGEVARDPVVLHSGAELRSTNNTNLAYGSEARHATQHAAAGRNAEGPKRDASAR
jgi:hypothetical protein